MRKITAGSWWNDGEREMKVTTANSRSVCGTTPEGGSCWYELWYFREKMVPGRLARKGAAR